MKSASSNGPIGWFAPSFIAWLEQQPWNKEYPPPTLAPDVIERVTERYLDICERITGARPFAVSS